jgi:hypothetical protein
MATNSKLEVTKRKLQEGYQEFDNGIVWSPLAYYYLLQHHIVTCFSPRNQVYYYLLQYHIVTYCFSPARNYDLIYSLIVP